MQTRQAHQELRSSQERAERRPHLGALGAEQLLADKLRRAKLLQALYPDGADSYPHLCALAKEQHVRAYTAGIISIFAS